MEFLPALALVLIASMAIPLTVIDFREHRLPNVFTYPAMSVSVATVAIAGLVLFDYPRMLISLAIGLFTFGIGFLLAKHNAIGMGDVKLLIAINVPISWFSPIAVLMILAIGFSLASIVSLILMALKKANLRTAIAMGPFLLIGFGAVLVDLASQGITAAGGS